MATINRLRKAAYLYRFTRDIEALLPEHYKRRCLQFMTKEPIPVHWRPEVGKFKVNPATGEKMLIQNVPVTVKYPTTSNDALWGGEGFVYGYLMRKNKGRFVSRTPKIWKPYVVNRVLYSEVLDRYMTIPVTLRTLDLIDDAFGFDFYILKTHEVDLNSRLAMKLKAEMLLVLAKKSLYPDDGAKRERIYDKYQQFVIPEEEAEWIGLSSQEAVAKVRQQVKDANPVRPLKDIFTEQLLEDLKAGTAESIESQQESWLGKLNPFTTKPLDEDKKS